MTNSKKKLILNSEYYSADTYLPEEENVKSIYIRVLIQLVIIFIIFGVLIFTYKYFMKNYYENISLWLMDSKVTTLIKDEKAVIVQREPIIIREELSIVKVKEKNVPNAKVISTPKELTAEYIKLVEDSLGNY